jgi:hypothetical protein
MDDSMMPADGFGSGDDLGATGYEHLSLDTNGDGLADSQFQGLDLNGDGINDIETVDIDTTGDGVADGSIVRMDLDGDGIADLVSVSVDIDGDGLSDIDVQDGSGVPDMLAVSDHSHDIWGDVDEGIDGGEEQHATAEGETIEGEVSFAVFAETYEEMTFDGYANFYEVHGTPAEDMALWDEQDAPNSCAVATTNMLFRSMGIDVGEDLLAREFLEQGIYNVDSGTLVSSIDDVINMFAAENGIDAQAVSLHASTVEEFEAILDSGVRPLVAVDAYELTCNDEERLLNNYGFTPTAGHAVQLTGIEHSSQGSFAVLNDPGHSNGAGFKIPLDAFLDAATDFGGACVAVGNHESFSTLSRVETELQSEGQTLLAGLTEPIHSDVWGNVYRGDSPFPISTFPTA